MRKRAFLHSFFSFHYRAYRLEEEFDFSTPITDDVALKAVWAGDFTLNTSDENMGLVGYAKQGETPDAQDTDETFTVIEEYDDAYSFIAEAKDGYRFVKWIDESGESVSTSKKLDYVCIADGSLTAVFEKKPAPAPFPIPKTGIE